MSESSSDSGDDASVTSIYLPLPLEIVLHIIACAVPTSPDVLLRPDDGITELLFAFTLVCHETRKVATRYLRQHCTVLRNQTSLSLYLLAIPTQPKLRTISSLSLTPFPEDLDDLPICSWVKELLLYTAETLSKLVIDMPLRTVYPQDDHLAVRRLLRTGFESLVNLREFVSVNDELYLDVYDREGAVVWSRWPKLERLALYNVNADDDFWRYVAQHPALKMLVLTNPDALVEYDPKVEYLKHTSRPLKVVCFTQEKVPHRELPEYADHDWRIIDPSNTLDLQSLHLDFDRKDDYYALKSDVKLAAETSEIWSWRGERITSPADISVLK